MVQAKLTDFDISEYLDDEESIASYLSAIMEEDDSQLLLAAIGDIAKARGMSRIASDSGLGRESLYKALNAKAKPRFDTILKVLHALGVSLTISPKSSQGSSRERAKAKPTVARAGRSKPGKVVRAKARA
ncbi:MAG: putative addiction module antidote protein [Verrucomicrobia bacterium]|jgi:probable addiction module antidote protein|nr:putative addiction module antidote protein [Verrucomicrobiota bacterium]